MITLSSTSVEFMAHIKAVHGDVHAAQQAIKKVEAGWVKVCRPMLDCEYMSIHFAAIRAAHVPSDQDGPI